MLALQINEIKQFMSMLLTQDTFDRFLVTEIELQMSYGISLDGRRNMNFYKEEEKETIPKEQYMLWQEMRPIVYQLIKGNKTPLSFRIVLMLTKDNTRRVVEAIASANFTQESVKGLFLNLSYDHEQLAVITGTSLTSFTLDKTMEREWDAYAKKFLKSKGIFFTE